MTRLSQLPETELQKIVALPYKAGLWISHADDVEGEADDLSEMKALERGIPELASLHKNSLLVNDVASAIMERKEQWTEWEEECFYIVKQAPEVIDFIANEFGVDEAKQYRAFTMELGKLVAQAHGEFSAFDEFKEEKESFFSSMINKIVGGISELSKDDAGHPANMSPAENSALSQLSKALSVKE